jgi:hypothetical protein
VGRSVSRLPIRPERVIDGHSVSTMAGGFAIGHLSNWRRNRFAYWAK